MLKLDDDLSYDMLKAFALDVFAGTEPGTYISGTAVVTICKLQHAYMLKAQMGWCSFTFFYPFCKFETKTIAV